MDEKFLEQADELARSEVLAGISRARVREPKPDGFDGDCTCGEPVPPARVALGYYRCTQCQNRAETFARHRR